MIPINGLVFVNLLSGTFFGTVNLAFTIISLILSVPIKNVLGDQACNWISLSGCFHLIGLIIWNCFIAICRILYIKAQNLMKYELGELRLFGVFISFGVHQSALDLEIVGQYMASVSTFNYQLTILIYFN